MGMQKNLSKMILWYKQKNHYSWDECAEALGIARSTLQSYVDRTGNPTLNTIKYLAERMGVDAIQLLFDPVQLDELKTAQCLGGAVEYISRLPEEKQIFAAERLLELANLGKEEPV